MQEEPNALTGMQWDSNRGTKEQERLALGESKIEVIEIAAVSSAESRNRNCKSKSTNLAEADAGANPKPMGRVERAAEKAMAQVGFLSQSSMVTQFWSTMSKYVIETTLVLSYRWIGNA